MTHKVLDVLFSDDIQNAFEGLSGNYDGTYISLIKTLKEVPKVDTSIKYLNNSELLDELVYAYEDMRDYTNRADHIKWSQEAETFAVNKYSFIQGEVLKRMSTH